MKFVYKLWFVSRKYTFKLINFKICIFALNNLKQSKEVNLFLKVFCLTLSEEKLTYGITIGFGANSTCFFVATSNFIISCLTNTLKIAYALW